MQRLNAKNPDNPEDNSSARTSRRDQPSRSHEIKKTRCDKTGKYFPKRGKGKKKTKNHSKNIFN